MRLRIALSSVGKAGSAMLERRQFGVDDDSVAGGPDPAATAGPSGLMAVAGLGAAGAAPACLGRSSI